MKRILLLGGSNQQLAVIKHVRSQGYHTVLCDYLPDNPGQYYADRFYCVSTTNQEAVLEVAQKEHIDGVVAYASDPAALTAAYVSEQMGLPAHPYKSIEILTNKEKFRAFLREHDFCSPIAKGYQTIEDAKADLANYRFPVIIKPVDSSGSKGVSLLNDTKDLESTVNSALSFSRSKRFIIEEYVEKTGYQVAGDGFSIEGQLVFRCFANDHFNGGLVPMAASIPCQHPRHIQDKIHREIQRLLTLLDMKTGAYNFDIRVGQDEKVYLMEIGPRNGGNYIPQVTKYATGIDMVEYTVKAALGEDCTTVKMAEPDGCWSYYAIHSNKSGILKDIWIKEEIKKDHIVEAYIHSKIGDHVPAFTDSRAAIGILIMRFAAVDQMLDMLDHPDDWIRVTIEDDRT